MADDQALALSAPEATTALKGKINRESVCAVESTVLCVVQPLVGITYHGGGIKFGFHN